MNARRLLLGLFASSVGLLVASCACTNGCRSFQDNATSLAYSIETGVNRLEVASEGTEQVVTYQPISNRSKPYIIILLPEGPVSEDDLVRKGVPWSVSYKILRDLNYVGVRDGRFIIVYQDGQINFTRFGMHLAKTKELLAHENRGESRVVLKKERGEIWIVGFK